MFLNKMTLASLVVLIAMGLVCFVTPTMAATFPDGAEVPDQVWKQGQANISITFPTATAEEDPAGDLSATLTIGTTAFNPGDTLTGILTNLTFTFDAATGVGKLEGENAHNAITGLTLVTYTVEETGGTSAVLPAFAVEIIAADELMFPAGTDINDLELIVATPYSDVLPVAVGGVGPLTYSIVGTLPPGMTFTPASRLLSGVPTAVFSRAVITYTVTDSAPTPATDNLTFTITVTPRPMGPQFAIAKVPDAAYTKGTEIEAYTLPAASETYAVGQVTYTLTPLPIGLSFDATTRMLTGTPNPTNIGDTTATYTATDAANNAKSVPFKITVNDVVSPVTPADFPAAGTLYLLGQRFADLPVPDATGGTGNPADYTYEVTGLPDGLMFDATEMEITGTPTAVGVSTVTITATDTVMAMGSAEFTITVTAAPNLSFSNVIIPQTYEVGTPITPMRLPAGQGGIPPHTYAVDPLTPLPDGLDFDPNTRLLSGTPRTAQTAKDHVYIISDSAFSHLDPPMPNTITLPFSITVTAPAQPTNNDPDFGTATVENIIATVGVAIPGRFLPEATDADNDTLTYSIEPALPTGLNFTPLNRALTGTPTTAMTETPYIYKVDDGNGGSDTIGFFITINAGTTPPDPTNSPPDFGDATIDNIVATVDVAIPGRVLPEATDPDGDTPTYSISPALPAGLTFNRTSRVLAGTPTTAMTLTAYTYTATDTAGGTDTIDFSITVNAATPIDVNGDGQVTVIDLAMVALFYGTRVPTGISLPADVNADGVVNILDLTAVANGIDTTSGGLNQLSQEDVKAAVSVAAEQAEDLEEVAAAPMHFSTRPDVRSNGNPAALNVTDVRHLAASDVLSKFLELRAETKAIPETSALLPNYPNPFNPETWIPYHLAKAANVTLTIYDVRGSVVRELRLGHQPAGVYESRGRAAYWDGRNTTGEKVASGLYFYTLTTGDFTATRKLLIAK